MLLPSIEQTKRGRDLRKRRIKRSKNIRKAKRQKEPTITIENQGTRLGNTRVRIRKST